MKTRQVVEEIVMTARRVRGGVRSMRHTQEDSCAFQAPLGDLKQLSLQRLLRAIRVLP